MDDKLGTVKTKYERNSENCSSQYQRDTEIILSSSISQIENGGKEELINLVKLVGGTKYVSGVNCIEYGLTHEYCKEQRIELIIDECTDYRNFVEFIDSIYIKRSKNETN